MQDSPDAGTGSDTDDGGEPAGRTLRRLWRHAGHHRRRMVAATAATTLNKVADVAPELLIGAAVDVIVQGDRSFVSGLFGVEDRFDHLVVLAVINAVVWAVESLSQYVAALLWRNLAQTIEHEARIDAYRHIQDLEVAWFEDTSSGGLLAVLNDDVNQLERFLDVGAATIIRTFWNIVLVGAVFAFTSWELTLLAFLPIPIIVVGSLRYQRRLEPFYARVRDRVSDLSSTLSTNLGGITTIKAFTAEDREAARVTEVSDAYRKANQEAIRSSSAFIPMIRMAHHRGRHLLGAHLHDPAPAVAPHRPRRDPRPLPAGHGLDPPHPRPAGGAAVHDPGHHRPAHPGGRRRAARGRARCSSTKSTVTSMGGRAPPRRRPRPALTPIVHQSRGGEPGPSAKVPSW